MLFTNNISMEAIKNGIKVLANIVLFAFYTLVTIIVVNFFYGLVLKNMEKVIPGSEDPVHIKMAILVAIMVFILTVVLRKYFYFKLSKLISSSTKKSSDISKGKLEQELDDDIKIYMDKEIK